ncbi:MAG TPA: histidine kinase, partial [Gammaproteobacteria bacterium]|nr:histidine kinase [Gammaproteobacteria bacterium]
ILPWLTVHRPRRQAEQQNSAALTVITGKRFRHLPVVEDGKLIGVVSIGDLVKAKLEATAQEAQALREYITT